MIPVVMASESGHTIVANPHPKLVLWGFSAAETGSSAGTAECVIRHGTNTSGTMCFAPLNFAADGFAYPTFLPFPMQCPNGLFVERRSGETTLVLYVDYQ